MADIYGNEYRPGYIRRAERRLKLPTSVQLKAEYEREEYRSRYRRTVLGILAALIAIAAAAVLAASFWFPVLRIYGTSMSPTFNEGEIAVSIKGSDFETGDIIAFYYEGKILIKRVIAESGSWVDIDEDGTVYVDGTRLEEDYLIDQSKGICDISLPYQVPDEKIFVMGDHRSVSVDSRSSAVGCIEFEKIVGRIVFRVWPFERLGIIE